MSVAVTRYVDTFVQECERLGVIGESDGRYRLVGCALECYYTIGESWRESLREAVGAPKRIEVGGGAREVGAGGGGEGCDVAGRQGVAADSDVRGTFEGEEGVVASKAVGRGGLSADGGCRGPHCAAVEQGSGDGGDVGPSLAGDGSGKVDGATLFDECGRLPAGVDGESARRLGAMRLVDDVARSVAGADSRACGGRSTLDRGRFGDESKLATKGKNYWSNQRKKEKRRKSQLLKESWRRVDGSGGCVSDESVAGTVRTVDTRTAVEIEAGQTLAARRVAENKVAAKLAEHRLRALNDVARTDAVDRLAAARAEKAINQAKAASQKSFKECDESMKSLGSTGSAGEFALKQAVKDARDNEKVHKYVQQQLALTLRYASDDVKRMVAELPEPTFEDEMEVFGDCPSEYNEDQRASYYMEINRRNCNRGEVDRPVADRPREEKLDPQVLMAKYSDGVKLTERELVVLEMAAAAGDV